MSDLAKRTLEVERARAMLHRVPPDVFNQFFEPIIRNDIGWEFDSRSATLHGSDWFRVLYPVTLPGIICMKWERVNFILDPELLFHYSLGDIELAIKNQTENVWAAIGRDSEASRKSIAWHKAKICETNSFHAPVTLALTPEGIKILDGHHRIAALIDLGLHTSTPVDAWVGVPDVPDA